MNVFVTADRAEEVLAPLAEIGVQVGDAAAVIERNGQARVWWDDTPVDLFFSYDPFHEAAAAGAVDVPFADGTIPVLSADHLAVCKVVIDRPKDWVDIDAMIELGTSLDAAEILRWVGRVVGDEDPRFDRIAGVLAA